MAAASWNATQSCLILSLFVWKSVLLRLQMIYQLVFACKAVARDIARIDLDKAEEPAWRGMIMSDVAGQVAFAGIVFEFAGFLADVEEDSDLSIG